MLYSTETSSNNLPKDETKYDSEINTQNWMKELPSEIKTNAHISSLSIPGSHDSFTYSLVRNGDAGPDQPGWIQKLTKMFPSISSHILYKWSITQDADLLLQLELGIRYFDIRLVAIGDENTSSKKEYHILHCLVGSRIVTILQALKNWMCLNEEEVIILDFQHCYRFEEEDYKEIVDIIMTEFPGKLCPWTKFKILTLDFMVKSGLQLIIIFPALYGKLIDKQTSAIPDYLKYFWPRKFCPTPWADTMNNRTLISFLDANLEQHNNSEWKSLFVSQGILTPTWRTVLFHPFSNTHKQCADKCQRKVKDWVNSKNIKPNIVITDFIDQSCIKDIISKNFKLK